MLFNIHQFEQYFKEKTLQQGLNLAKRVRFELVEKHSAAELRFSGGGQELLLKKKGDKLLSYSCSCNSSNYCKHLAAALFIAQNEKLNLVAQPKTNGRAPNNINPLLKKIRPADLITYLQKPLRNNNISSLWQLLNEDNCMQIYSGLLKIMLSPNYKTGQLNQLQIDKTHQHLLLFLKKTQNLQTDFNTGFYAHLALLCELQEVLQFRFTGLQTPLENLKHQCEEFLHNVFVKKLSPKQKHVWHNSLLFSLRNNKAMRGHLFSFLLPRFLSWSQSKIAFNELNELLSKRKIPNNYQTKFKPLKVAQFQIKIREEQVLSHTPLKVDKNDVMDEIMARVELSFCQGKLLNAFKLLDKGYELLNLAHFHFFDEYTRYCVNKACYYNNNAVELKYLEARFVKGLYINEAELKRWLTLLPVAEKDVKVAQLLDTLSQPKYYSFNKLSQILLLTNNQDGLLAEIKRQDNAYRLLHTLVLTKFPVVDTTWLLLYVKHFIAALSAIKVYQHQQSLFETARQYIDKLTAADKTLILDKIITYNGSESQLSKHIRQLYGLV